jgi:tetraacyldisaccharide 4'-kinase
MNLLRIILLPLVPVYAAVISIRNWFFDKNVFNSKKVNAQVISIGNITVGGSGKTPLVIYLTNLLKKEGQKVGVLSRGYGRRSSGYLLVSDGEKIFSKVEDCGDEIYHTVKECRVPAAVSEKRVSGAEKFIAETGINTIVLDDAFQHRWIGRDINLVICEQRFLNTANFINHSLLPTGNLREPFNSLQRADVIIINRKFSEPTEIPKKILRFFEGKNIYRAKYKAVKFVDVIKNIEYKIEDFTGQKSLLVSGIANPYSFINALRQSKVDTQNQIIFKDHKDYTHKEIQQIRKKFYSTNSYSVLTTGKDAVKLSKFSNELDDIDVYYLKIELQMDEEENFKKFILSRLNL